MADFTPADFALELLFRANQAGLIRESSPVVLAPELITQWPTTDPAGSSILYGIFRGDGYASSRRSDARFQFCCALVTIAHRLSDPRQEDNYYNGDMLAQTQLLLDPEWYALFNSVYDVDRDEPPRVVTELARSGDVIAWEFSVRVLLARGA